MAVSSSHLHHMQDHGHPHINDHRPRAAAASVPHKAPPTAPVRKASPPAKKSHALLYTLLALTVMVVVGGTYWSMKAHGPVEPTAEALTAQIEAAATGKTPPTNVYGGMIFSDHGNPASVTVSGIPNQACVSAGWRLARSGIVTINGTMPQRISAAILSELCNQDAANALSWSPKTE
ncbi:MAG: hypothetical protein HQL43_10245 [Alphaproteobacteria bacterium]|nr:hypothetical protein [Alphaproteobacteria bacterium]